MANKKRMDKKNVDKDNGAFFVPAGLFLGIGLGFLYNILIPGLFIGLGVGFLLYAIINMIKRKK